MKKDLRRCIKQLMLIQKMRLTEETDRHREREIRITECLKVCTFYYFLKITLGTQ